VSVATDAQRAIVFDAGLRAGILRVRPCAHRAALVAMLTRV
jgi:hypothetical protein